MSQVLVIIWSYLVLNKPVAFKANRSSNFSSQKKQTLISLRLANANGKMFVNRFVTL